MKSRLYLIDLYDLYGELLTEKQQRYFEDYYFSNFSLSEIAENIKVSRNAIHNQLKEVEKKLFYYENHLHLHEKKKKIETLLNELDEKMRSKFEKLL